MLYDNILTPEEINMSTVFNEYDNLKNIIEKSLLKGELTYAIPAKVNEIESYQFPIKKYFCKRNTIMERFISR